jgi:hypothetical protein
LKATVPLTLSADGLTVYDRVNNFTWLADFNFPASNRFGVPVCSGMSIDPKTCVNPSGSMSYQAATAWVAAMNAANSMRGSFSSACVAESAFRFGSFGPPLAMRSSYTAVSRCSAASNLATL